MPEYIVKEQALEAILSAIELTGEQWAQVWNKIKQTPPADVVGVVRCKDCVYKIGNIDSAIRNFYDFDFFCLRFNSYVRGDGYCDFGARMDGGESDEP